MDVKEAVKRDLKAVAKRDKELARSALAASALRLAEALDNPKNSATSKAMCAGRLLETLDRLRELVPPEQEKDALDDLQSRRAARLARSAKAKS